MKNQRGNSLITVLAGIAVALLLGIGIYVASSWEKVPVGHVGVHVYLLGGEKGVDAVTRPVGRHWVGWQQEMYLYPTFTQTARWEATPEVDTSVRFNDTDGTQLGADIGMSFRVDPSKAAGLFQTYRKPIEDIIDGQLRQFVADALNGEAGQLKVDAIYGKGREALLQRVEKRTKEAFAPKGIIVERLAWLGPVRLPAVGQKSLEAKIQATQIAVQRENEVQATIAEAVKNREQAKGEADAQLLRARAEAEAIQIKGEALRNNQELVALTIAEKWNGQLPDQLITSGNGGGGPILQLLAPQK